jgi:hypothetical protein
VLLHGRAVVNVQAAISAILVATLYVPGDTSGIDRLFDGLIGAAIGLVIDAVFARSPVCGRAVAVTGTGARGSRGGPFRSGGFALRDRAGHRRLDEGGQVKWDSRWRESVMNRVYRQLSQQQLQAKD